MRKMALHRPMPVFAVACFNFFNFPPSETASRRFNQRFPRVIYGNPRRFFQSGCFSFQLSDFSFLAFSHLMPFLSALMKHPWVMTALGGAIGSVGRLMVSSLVARWTGEAFPFGTIVVNVSGAVLMGLLAGYGQSEPGKLVFSEPSRTFLMIGVMGGYTTFSSFSLQTFLLMEQGNLTGAAINVILSVVLCVAGIWAGFSMIRALL